MRHISKFPKEVAAEITTVFTDIDDTLTTDGQLPAVAYSALEALKQSGISVVPVTGRPAGWCDMIARFWPVRGVVGENGAFYFAYDAISKTMCRTYFADAATRAADQQRLLELRDKVLAEVPGCAVSADQPYREVDMAIDFCEDVEPLGEQAVAKIKSIFEAGGATSKVSSIHVNSWFGDFDKLTMTRRFTQEVLGSDLNEEKHRFVFCGDSPNDAPMFGYFPNSCGVANVLDFEEQLEAKPTWITTNRGGEGFVELANILLAARGL